MKTTIYILLFIAFFCYISKINISLNPFSIKFNSLELGFGWIFIATSIVLFTYNIRKEERSKMIKHIYSEGLIDGFNILKKESNKAAYELVSKRAEEELKETENKTKEELEEILEAKEELEEENK